MVDPVDTQIVPARYTIARIDPATVASFVADTEYWEPVLREELSALFASGESTVVYATTEPTEAQLEVGRAALAAVLEAEGAEVNAIDG